MINAVVVAFHPRAVFSTGNPGRLPELRATDVDRRSRSPDKPIPRRWRWRRDGEEEDINEENENDRSKIDIDLGRHLTADQLPASQR